MEAQKRATTGEALQTNGSASLPKFKRKNNENGLNYLILLYIFIKFYQEVVVIGALSKNND